MVCDQSDSLATETVAGRSRRQEKETSGAMQSTLLMRGLDGKNLILKQRSFDLFCAWLLRYVFVKNIIVRLFHLFNVEVSPVRYWLGPR